MATSTTNDINKCNKISELLEDINNYLDDSLSTNLEFQKINSNIKLLTSEIIKPLNRNKFPDDGISVIMKAIELSTIKNTDSYLQLRTELFRFLRNLCSMGKHFQVLIAKNNIFIQTSKNTACLVLEENVDEDSLKNQCLRCVVQFWGNLVVNNSANKVLIWFELKCIIRKLLSHSTDEKIINYTNMLLYNCFRDEKMIIQDLIDDSDLFLSICNSIIDSTSEKDIEWGLYTLQMLLKTHNLLEKLFKELSSKRRLFFIEVIKQTLIAAHKIHISNILFLVDELKRNWHEILSTSETTLDEFEPIILLNTLDVLCSASISDDFREDLQKDLDLLSTIIYLLKTIHWIGKKNNNNFTPITKLSAVANPQELSENPVNGMKRDLVRLIGNLCWKCKRSQDHIRELDGIALLLDCCNIDARNPFIIQWGIFALRNLLENNLENQKVIKEMEKLESVDNNILDELKVKILNDKRDTPETFMNQNLDDIEQLFE